MDAKLQEVMAGKAPEYLEPLANLQENMLIRTKVAGEDGNACSAGWGCRQLWLLLLGCVLGTASDGASDRGKFGSSGSHVHEGID